jgi:hypothetical protein
LTAAGPAHGGHPPVFVRSGPVGLLELLRCRATVALTNLTPPPTELAVRWRTTLIYGAFSLGYAVALAWWGFPAVIAPIGGWVAMVLVFTAAYVGVGLVRGADQHVWRAWRGLAGAVCIVYWDAKRQRYEAHSWAAFPRHHHLGRAVGQAALDSGLRPLWLKPALPRLRDLIAATASSRTRTRRGCTSPPQTTQPSVNKRSRNRCLTLSSPATGCVVHQQRRQQRTDANSTRRVLEDLRDAPAAIGRASR